MSERDHRGMIKPVAWWTEQDEPLRAAYATSVLTGTWVGSDGVVHVLHDIGERCSVECRPVTP